jgi:hypothetical protein
MISKKSQAILPFFAVQLVSIMVFIIVLLTLLTMSKDVRFTINEFDERTAFLLSGRRLVSSADCFAYEERALFYDTNVGRFYSGTKVFPNILDINKLLDYENFNCIRKDFYDKEDDVLAGYWDAQNATGGVFSYMIRVVDLTNGQEVYDSPATKDYATSLVGRINKTETATVFNATNKTTCEALGGYWKPADDSRDAECTTSIDCGIYGGEWYDSWNGCINDLDFKTCAKGRCYNSSNSDPIKTITDVRPYWIVPYYANSSQCLYVFDNTKVTNFSDDNATALTVNDTDNALILRQMDWGQFDSSCENVNNTRSMVMPTMMRVGNELHPAVIYIKTCLLFGQNYEGRTLLEIEYKPNTGGQGCVS